MPRTYSENSEPRKVYQADTIRGFTEDEVKNKLSFQYEVGYTAGSTLANIFMKNSQRYSSVNFDFEKTANKLFCTAIAGDGWYLMGNYSVPITPEEGQTLLTTGELSQTIDGYENEILCSPVILKDFVGFYGSLHTVIGKNYCSGVVYEPTLTQKLYFVYIIVTGNTATWKLIPIT